ncbi:PTS transporter subunit IIC [Erysipelothrix aquatica]|uniref:PTS transporter subunit IIC n=1 Tax=Erysipelothrix aquatica TaxID=2683714 RepID=UPI001359476C|nr:PTS sugar transporter subunit IIC [Erysipelothrix aquatica]
MTKKPIFEKGFGMKILNGIAVGSVVVLIPGALLNELFKALLPIFPQGQFVLDATSLAMTMMAVVIGYAISMQFKFTPIETASVAMAAGLGSGAWKFAEGGSFLFAGSGDIINISITATIATIMILYINGRFKAYTLLLTPTLVLIIAGGIGVLTLPYVKMFTGGLASMIGSLMDFQPIIMSLLMASIFAVMIVSPISTVGIALAINLTGVGSAAANIGICATAFGLAITGWKANSTGISIALMAGSPKMAMANVIKKPKIMLPIVCNAAIAGMIGAILGQQGTPMSAGFGISGFIGPINAINLAGGWTFINILQAIIAFIVVPVVLSFIFRYVFTTMKPIVSPEDYKIEVQ